MKPAEERRLQAELDRYWDTLHRSQLADKSIEDYYYFAECFVRWMRGEFTPGGMIRSADD